MTFLLRVGALMIINKGIHRLQIIKRLNDIYLGQKVINFDMKEEIPSLEFV